MITKAAMEGRDRKRNRPSRSEHGKQQTYVWACAGYRGLCQGKMHPRIECQTHGSKEEAERCNRRALKALGGTE